MLVGGLDAASEGREIGREHAHERLVARAAAGDDVVDGRVADAEPTKCCTGERDAARGERGGSGEECHAMKGDDACASESTRSTKDAPYCSRPALLGGRWR